MSWPYLHTLVNHFPIVLATIGALAVLISAMVQRRGVWLYALSTLTLAGLTIYPAWLTGGEASRVVHNAWYIESGSIHSHSVAAGVTLWVVGVTGFLSLIALVTMIRTSAAVSPARAFRVLVGLGSLVSICAVAYTGYLGGRIVLGSAILASPTPPAAIAAPLPGGALPTPSGTPSSAPSSAPSSTSGAQGANPGTVPAQPVQPVPPPAQQPLPKSPSVPPQHPGTP